MEKSSEKLSVKVTDHVFVPHHEILPPKEVEKFLKKYNVRIDQLPYILSTDPVMKEKGAKPGDLIKITRKSKTAGEVTYYRYVIEG
ncbi:MAG: DNA-directed RNA polymerase subunit H [Nitrososphaerales archaeon]|nr:DNA-directed RNA polymerase subunit H [Nitrososphaerales archaeon]